MATYGNQLWLETSTGELLKLKVREKPEGDDTYTNSEKFVKTLISDFELSFKHRGMTLELCKYLKKDHNILMKPKSRTPMHIDDMIIILQVSRRTVTRLISELKEKNILARVKIKDRFCYIINPKFAKNGSSNNVDKMGLFVL